MNFANLHIAFSCMAALEHNFDICLLKLRPIVLTVAVNCSCCTTSLAAIDAFLLSCLFIGVEIITLQLGTFSWMNSFNLNIFEIISFDWWSTESLVSTCRMTI